MNRNDARPPIWFWMVVILVIALYMAGYRVLMRPQVGGPEQAATKIWVGFWLCSLTAVVLAIGEGLCQREGRALFFAMFRPPVKEATQAMLAPEEQSQEPLDLEAGQRFRLPDGEECVVVFCANRTPPAMLNYVTKREYEEPGVYVDEYLLIDRTRAVWRCQSKIVGPKGISGKDATGWTVEDLEPIAGPA